MTTTTAIEGPDAGKAGAPPASQGGPVKSPNILSFTTGQSGDVFTVQDKKEEKKVTQGATGSEEDAEIVKATAEVRHQTALTELRAKALAQFKERAGVEEEL